MTSTPFSDVPTALLHYLARQHVVSIAAHTAQDFWCASCFYAFEVHTMSLLLMSDPATRHGGLWREQPQVAGTIADQTKNIALIKGIQYAGRIELLQAEQAQAATAIYVQRFPIARLKQAPIWRLALQEIKLTDNKAGFGSKLYWARPI